MTGHLLDVNVLLALAWPNHQFHAAARRWFEAQAAHGWATCAITELGFIRLSSNPAFSRHAVVPAEAAALLATMTSHTEHRFVDVLPPCTDGKFVEVLARLLGHRQTTDAYLLALASHHELRLATFDGKLARFEAGTSGIVLLAP